MKVLHINQSDHTGGAAVAAMRLLEAQRSIGINAEMLALKTTGDHTAVHPVIKSRFGTLIRNVKFIGEVISFVPYEKKRQNRFAFSRAKFGFDISSHPKVREADILHLHWINQGFLSITDLKKLIETGKPIVWTLHDTWPFTGGCHYPGICGGFTSACGHCPLLKSPGPNDLSARQHKRKEQIFVDAKITFVGCSNWMREMAAKSSLIRKDLNHKTLQVFNPINTDLFKPANRQKVRQELGLPQNKKLLLFGAANIADPRKGINFLLRAVQNINANHHNIKENLELVAFGKNITDFEKESPFRIHSFDIVTSQEKMAKLYQASDLFVLPSMQDNLPNTVVESLSCGTPVVAFTIGGVPEMVVHNQSGYLATPDKWRDLGNGILTTLDNSEQFGKNARDFAEIHFSQKSVASQYHQIYNTILPEHVSAKG